MSSKKVVPDITKGQSNDVVSDAYMANTIGVSYGQYKTGVRNISTDSDYSVSPTAFVKRTYNDCKDPEGSKSVAFIK